MASKHYPSQVKERRTEAEFITQTACGQFKNALDVRDIGTVHLFGADAAEAGSTTSVINATAHVAVKGDRIRFTSGALNTIEADVKSVNVNDITLLQTLPSAPGAGDGFDILRQTSLTLTASGGITTSPGPIQFRRDGVPQEVVEDTVTPANNRPLPVQLQSVTGNINITANDLHVQLDHTGATPDSVRIGDGVETANVNASNELQVADDTARTTLGTINGKLVDGTDIGDVTVNNAAGAAAVNIQDGGNSLTVDQGTHDNLNLNANLQVGDADVANGNPVPVSDAGGSLTVDQATHDNLNLNANLQIGDADVANLNPVPVSDAGSTLSIDDGAGSITVDQATHDNLNLNANLQVADADVANGNPVPISDAAGSLTVDQATHDNLNLNANLQVGNVDVANGNPVPISDAGSTISIDDGGGSITVDGTLTANVTALDVVDFLDTPLLDASSTNIPASAGVPVTVVASLAAAVQKIQFADTTGKFIGVYSDPAGAAVLECIIGPGSDQTIEVSLPATTVIGLRNMENAAITVGNLMLNFMG